MQHQLELLGEEIDIHSGEDNIFPHHECEISITMLIGREFSPSLVPYAVLNDRRRQDVHAGTCYVLEDLPRATPAAVRWNCGPITAAMPTSPLLERCSTHDRALEAWKIG